MRAQPGAEIVGTHGDSDRGWELLARAINSAWYHKVGGVVCDAGYLESEGVLSTVEARDRRYKVRTPYVTDSGAKYRVFFDLLRDATSTTWTFDVHSGVDSWGTTQFHGGTAYNGLWYAGTIEVDDSGEDDEIRIEYITSDTSKNYVRGIYLLPYRQDTTLPDGVYDTGFAALDTDMVAENMAASTYFLREAALIAERTYERGVGTIATNGREYDFTSGGASPGAGLGGGGGQATIAAIPVTAPAGVSTVDVHWYVTQLALSGDKSIWWAWLDDGTITETAVASTGWKMQTATGITPGETRVLILGIENIKTQSLCVFFGDATL